jgi:phosphatidylglycerol:prolipoprotein diacylglycerol transferase
MLVAAFGVSSFLAAGQARKNGLQPETVFNLVFMIFIFGIIGARIFYIIENLDFYLADPGEVFMLQHGGLSWFGGLILGVIAASIGIKRKKLNILKVADLLSPFVALGQAIGRLGCLLNGCCGGRTVISLQIYSSFILILIFIVLRFLQEKPHKEGEVFFAYLILYSLKRFCIEFWRADYKSVFAGLTLFQLISAVVLLIGLIGYARVRFKDRAAG